MAESPHRSQLLTRPTNRSLTAVEVANVERAKHNERAENILTERKRAVVEHRVAGHSRKQRMNSA